MATRSYQDLIVWQKAMDLVNELETQVLVARRLAYLNEDQHKPIMATAAEVGRLLSGLTHSLTAKIPGP